VASDNRGKLLADFVERAACDGSVSEPGMTTVEAYFWIGGQLLGARKSRKTAAKATFEDLSVLAERIGDFALIEIRVVGS
jgi:hypothetical protein